MFLILISKKKNALEFYSTWFFLQTGLVSLAFCYLLFLYFKTLIWLPLGTGKSCGDAHAKTSPEGKNLPSNVIYTIVSTLTATRWTEYVMVKFEKYNCVKVGLLSKLWGKSGICVRRWKWYELHTARFHSQVGVRVSQLLKRCYLDHRLEAMGVIFIDETLSSQPASLSVHHTAVNRGRAPQWRVLVTFPFHNLWKQNISKLIGQRGNFKITSTKAILWSMK